MGDRAAHPANLRRPAPRPAGVALPGPPPPGTSGLDRGGMGRVRQQPPRALLLADEGWSHAAPGRGRQVGAPVVRRQPRAAKDVALRAWLILRNRLRSFVFRRRRESDLSEELQLHLDRDIERLQATGLSRQEARFRAMRQFGGVEHVKDACRDARGTPAIDALARDARYACRRLVRDWRFT